MSRNCKALGAAAWLELANIMTETLIILKFGRGEFTVPTPTPVIIFWICLVTIVIVYAIWQFWLSPRLDKKAASIAGKEMAHTENTIE